MWLCVSRYFVYMFDIFITRQLGRSNTGEPMCLCPMFYGGTLCASLIHEIMTSLFVTHHRAYELVNECEWQTKGYWMTAQLLFVQNTHGKCICKFLFIYVCTRNLNICTCALFTCRSTMDLTHMFVCGNMYITFSLYLYLLLWSFVIIRLLFLMV